MKYNTTTKPEEILFCDLNDLDVSRVTDFSWLFSFMNFQADVSKWNMKNARNLSFMFSNSSLSLDSISSWNTENVIDMSFMFSGSTISGVGVSNWNTKSLVNITGMFNRCSGDFKISDLLHWDLHRVSMCDELFFNTKITKDNRDLVMLANKLGVDYNLLIY